MNVGIISLILQYLVPAVVFVAVGAASYAIASAPAMQPNYLGIRGLRRARALANGPSWQKIEPTVRWLGTRIRPLLNERSRQKLDRQLVLSGDWLGLLPEEFIALTLIGGVAGSALGGAYSATSDRGAMYPVLIGLLGAALPYLQVTGLHQERQKRVQHGLPSVIDLLALALSAGLDFVGALRQVVEKSSTPNDPLIEELNLVLQEIQVGKTRKVALQQFAERNPSESVREFVGAIVQAEERGNPLGKVLQIQAESSRQRRSVRAEEAASKAGVRMLLPMVLVFLAVLTLLVAPMAIELSKGFG